MASLANAQTCVPTPAGAVYWLGGERHFDDLAGYHNAMVVGPGVGFTAGEVGDAIHFGGALEDRVNTDTSYPEERALRTAFTIELWARPTATLPDCPESNSGTCAQSLPWAVFPEHGANSAPPGDANLAAGIGIAIGTNGVCVGEHSVSLLPCLARVDVPLNDWTHVAVVVEDKTPKIFLNGALAHTGATSDKDFVFASWSILGSIDLEFYGTYAGDIDELTVYNRALDAGEIATLFAAGAGGKCKSECVVEQSDDLWQNALVTAHTALESDRADCMFGATGCSPEPDTTLFADGLPDGTVHSVDWETEQPFTLGAIRLHAFHNAFDDTQRAFRHVLIQAREIGGTFATVYDSDVALPYGQGPVGRELLRCPSVRPVHAQQFHAEFEQDGENLLSGPRIQELDGILRDLIFADGMDPD